MQSMITSQRNPTEVALHYTQDSLCKNMPFGKTVTQNPGHVNTF